MSERDDIRDGLDEWDDRDPYEGYEESVFLVEAECDPVLAGLADLDGLDGA